MTKPKIWFIAISVVAVAVLVTITGVVYASPQTTVTPNCSGSGNNNGQQMNLQIDDQDQPWGNGVSNTWSALNMAPGQTCAFTGNFVGLSINTPSTALITCDYKDSKGIPDQMAQKMILTKCVYGSSLWSVDCLTGNWQIFAPASIGNISSWKLTDVDKDGFITLYDLKKSPLNYLPLPASSVTNSTKLQISVEFAPTAGNNLQSESLNMNMDFTATSWDTSSNIGGISPALMRLFLGQPLALTTTCVTSSQNPSIYLQSVTFTAKVTGPGGIPTGTVQFQIDGTNFGLPVSLTSGSANIAISALSVGNHAVTAIYSGDSNYAASTGTLCGGQTVKPILKLTSTTVTSSINPSVFGQPVVFTANVSGTGGTPTGKVQFQIDGANFGSPVSLINGSANSPAISTLSVGNHVVTAVYGGDGNYSTSTGTLSGGQTVKPATKSTSTLVTSSNNPSYYGQSVTFTAKVTGAGGIPSGTVQFLIDGTNFGKAVTLSNGTATSGAITTLAIGTHTVTAVYNGDSSFAASTGTLSGGQKVRCKTTITWPYKPNPCNFGQTCTFKVQIGEQSPGTVTPTGDVTFYDGSNIIGTRSLSGGTAILNCLLPAGSHSITATYNGDDNNDGSTSAVVTQTVNKAGTAISLNSSSSTTNSKVAVTFTATVTPNSATGTVTFKDGNIILGTGALKGGQATFSTSSLCKGTHSITAVYGGDSSFNGSSSSVLSQVIK